MIAALLMISKQLRLSNFLLLFLTVYSLVIPQYANSKDTINLQVADSLGFSQSYRLSFDGPYISLIEQLKIWKSDLAKKGFDVDFLIGAGELRRALLGQSTTGPGDVEMFIRLKNVRLPKTTVTEALKFLRENGSDIDGKMRELFGQEKTLDYFIKDQSSIENQRPWRTRISYFEGAGDTSINSLLYDVSKELIEGEPSDLEALSKQEITYKEIAKVQRFEEPRNITGTNSQSHFPETAIRMAFRTLRLIIDLKLSPNPNNLKASDPNMDLALRGVENFFGETPLDQVRLFSIDDETYLKQFIKIFDKKTLTERDWIRKFLLAQYPKTYEILMALGLNVDLLATAPRIDSKVKVNAVIQNARFQYIRGFVLNGPKNPFLTGTGVQAIADFHSQIKRDLQAQNYQYNQAQRALEGKKPTAFKPIDYKFAAIPLKLVELVDPSLVWYLKNFDKLPVYGGAEEVSQTSVMRAYLKLVDDFNGEASKRAKGTEFLDRYGRYLVGLNWPSDDDKSQATVLDLWKEQAKTTTIATISSVSLKDIGSHLLSINTELFQRASSIIGSGKKPVVFIDLDDTLYPMKNRIFGILKKYDIDHNTSYFQNLTVTDVKDGKAHDSVSEFLSSQGNSVEEVLRVRESLFFYFTNQYFSYEALQIDQPFPAIKQLIERLQSKGVEIVFLTARKEFLRRSTEARLNSLGISYSALLMNNAPEDQFYRANLDKPKQAAAYISDNTALEPLAFLDNDRGVVKALGLNFPSAMTLQAAQPKTKGSWSPTVVLLKDPFDLYSLKTQSCSRHLKSK